MLWRSITKGITTFFLLNSVDSAIRNTPPTASRWPVAALSNLLSVLILAETPAGKLAVDCGL